MTLLSPFQPRSSEDYISQYAEEETIELTPLLELIYMDMTNYLVRKIDYLKPSDTWKFSCFFQIIHILSHELSNKILAPSVSLELSRALCSCTKFTGQTHQLSRSHVDDFSKALLELTFYYLSLLQCLLSTEYIC